ncbi:MAG TPA: hypothetical protein VGO55_10565 [Allosphingosinicella sp.]|jgi:hypothetical protein|nr:hypothetical protein [Allosphingosinicella sp.]
MAKIKTPVVKAITKGFDLVDDDVAKLTIQAQMPADAGHARLPTGTVERTAQGGLTLNVAKLNQALMRDQRSRLVSSMGCISNPGGPGC